MGRSLAALSRAERRPPFPDFHSGGPVVPDSSALPDLPAVTALLAEGLARYEEAGVAGLCTVLRSHPEHSREVVRRLLLLAELGLLPDPPRTC
jgi:hypothetical protein